MLLFVIMSVYLSFSFFFFLMIRRPPRSTLFPTRRSSDLFGWLLSHYVVYGFVGAVMAIDRKSTRLNSSHLRISYAVFCLKKKTQKKTRADHSRDSAAPAARADRGEST